MPEIALSPLPAAVGRILAKRPVAARLSSAEWQRVPVALRERAQFSARVESARFLATVQAKLAARIGMLAEEVGDGKTARVDRSSFIGDLRKLAQEEGIGSGTGGLTDVSSRQRLGLIYDIQTRQAAEFARWQVGSDPDLVDEFPAQELIREEQRMVPRNWIARWAGQGGRFFDGRMIALKNDPIWRNLGPFGVPYPPFDFGSGMGVMDVSREECEALGVLPRGEKAASPDEALFNDRLEASTAEFPEQARQEFKRAFGDKVSVAGDSVAWVGERGVAVGDLWDRTREKPDIDAVVRLGAPRPQVLKRVQEVLGEGREWEGVLETVSSKDFNHVFHDHPDLAREDALRIPLVLDSPDDVSRGKQPRTVKLKRRFRDGTVYYVEAYVQPKLSWPGGEMKAPPELRTKTLWKEKAATGMP